MYSIANVRLANILHLYHYYCRQCTIFVLFKGILNMNMVKIVVIQRGLNGKGKREIMHTIDFTFPQIVHLEGRHLLGEDGLGQVEKGGVIDGEVTVVLVQNPHCCSLYTALHETEEENKLP